MKQAVAEPRSRWWPLRWLLGAAWLLARVLVVGWATLAVYYQMGRSWLAITLALIILALGIWGLWLARSAQPPLIFAASLAVVLVWWSTIAPSHDRHWRPEVAQMPRAIVDGDRVRFTGFRNFDYRSADDFTARYEEREVSISDLVAVDFFVSYWMPGPFGHTFLSFVFANSPPDRKFIRVEPGTYLRADREIVRDDGSNRRLDQHKSVQGVVLVRAPFEVDVL